MISLPDMILSDLLRRSEGLLEIQVAYHIGITLSGYNIASASDFVNSFWENFPKEFSERAFRLTNSKERAYN